MGDPGGISWVGEEVLRALGPGPSAGSLTRSGQFQLDNKKRSPINSNSL